MTECAGRKLSAQPPLRGHSVVIGPMRIPTPSLDQAESAAGRECDQQGCDNHACSAERKHSPTVFRRPAAPDQQNVGGDHPLDYRGVAEPFAHRSLVEMLTMRFPHALTT